VVCPLVAGGGPWPESRLRSAPRKVRGLDAVGEEPCGDAGGTLCNDLVSAGVFGVGGTRRALELLRLKPAVYLSIEIDKGFASMVSRAWPDAVRLGDIASISDFALVKLGDKSRVRKGLAIGGFPRQSFSRLFLLLLEKDCWAREVGCCG
jgi:hypothetical protein